MPNDRLNWTFNGDPGQAGAGGTIRSLTTNDINMVFQPIVDVATGALFAHEALVRCKLPQFASPLTLFATAETEKACGYLGSVIRQQTFERCQDVALFVNVHPEELSQRWLVRPDDPLNFHEREVYLEITESAAFTHYDLCMNVLKELCSRSGVHLVVDDYGAGHSNLARILDLNPKIVKLDGALIRGIAKDPRRQLMVRHMVALCVDLGSKVVAECVETVEELKAVADLGVHYAQGYVLARPAFPAPEFAFPLSRREGPVTPGRARPPPKPAQQTTATAPRPAPAAPQSTANAAQPAAAPRAAALAQPAVAPRLAAAVAQPAAAPRPAAAVAQPAAVPRVSAGAAPRPNFAAAPTLPVAAAPTAPTAVVAAKSNSKRPAKLPSKRPSKRPTPPALPPAATPKRPPPLPGAR